MAKKCKGIRHIKDDAYFLDYQVGKIRKQVRVRAISLSEAKAIRQERIVELRKKKNTPGGEQQRLTADFSEAREKLMEDLLSDGVCQKNLLRNKLMFTRMFEDFRKAKFPQIQYPSQVTMPFLQEYKSYYVNELGHNPRGGLRAELIFLKSMVRRLGKFGFIKREIVDGLGEIKRPKGEKKNYISIPNAKIKELLDYIKDDRPDYHDLINFMARVGRRINEVSLIERRDVEWRDLLPVRLNIRGETTKCKEDSPLDKIDDGLAKVIVSAYRRGSEMKTVYLFCNRYGKKCSSGSVLKYLKDVSERVIGVIITPHYFRHRFLTECGRARVHSVDSMSIAGIKDPNVVARHYDHCTEAGKEEVLAVTRIG